MITMKEPWSAIRFASAMIAWSVITLTYYSFHHYVHHRTFNFSSHGNANNDKAVSSGETHAEHAQRLLLEGHEEVDHGSSQGASAVHEEHRGHGQRFDNFQGKDDLFFYGLALPLALLTVASLIWNKSKGGSNKSKNSGTNLKALGDLQLRSETSSDTSSSDGDRGSAADGSAQDTTLPEATTDHDGPIAKARRYFTPKNNGDVNIKKWTIIWFLVPMLFIILDGMRSRNILHASADQRRRGWGLYKRVCMSLLSPSGYAATWPLALFLIPVTKHSPILDWLRVTPIQALAFHRICGWVSFWWSWAHGFLHLQHLMEVGNKGHVRTSLQQLKYLLVPDEMGKCFVTQGTVRVFWGEQAPYPGTEQESHQCWLALVNGTGMVSCIAFAILAITSIASFRRNFYTLFYVIHIPTAWIMLFAAIWHYPMCVLLLVPNIIYYLSFNIPVCATQGAERWVQWRADQKRKSTKDDPEEEEQSSALVEVNLIQGGSIEMTFAVAQEEIRHENCYVRVFCPGASAVSHPFSIFSRDDLEATRNVGPASLATRSVLLRSKGPFTEALKNALFPHHAGGGDTERLASIGPSFELTPSLHHKIQFDSFYAGSVDWVHSAMESHDEIMILAGGVGIVPFLEFLPALQRQIETADRDGPKRIHLHWYCREVGLASHVLTNYISPHVRGAWDSNPTCHGRLKVHVHLTQSSEGEDALANISNSGLVEKHSYMAGDGESRQGTIRFVQDARFTQSLGMRLLLPGFLMVGGILGHWWWYTQFIRAEIFRRNNLFIRSHGVIFSLLLAVVVSVLVEVYARRRSKAGYSLVNGVASISGEQKKENQRSVIEATTSDRIETAALTETSTVSLASTYAYASTANKVVYSDFLRVTAGRPSIETVIQDILKAKQPGVYSCGPRALLDAVEGSIRHKRSDCAFYQEDSEM